MKAAALVSQERGVQDLERSAAEEGERRDALLLAIRDLAREHVGTRGADVLTSFVDVYDVGGARVEP